MQARYNDLNNYLRSLFGERVQKITVDAGLTCPNRDGSRGTGGCIYCNPQGSGTGLSVQGIPIARQIESAKKGVGQRYKAKKFLAYFQSFTNTYAPVERLKEMYDEAFSVEGVVGLSIGTRPDCVDQEKIDLIAGYAEKHLIWMEYGLQSVHDSTLDIINRGHDYETFVKAVEMTKNRGIKICCHIILGLPGETRGMMLASARKIASLGIDGVKLHLLYVVKGTALDEMYKKGDYTCMSRDEYSELACDFLELLPPEMIIHRITADPHPDELVAPMWALDKTPNRQAVIKLLEKRDTWQGRLYEPCSG
ncbi:TIGR01212 family radical SAM protein [Desulforegula conservatrix]|uniref:TIGR01212 family radical SAM protein n=1 Tax=Desulforegula conservatrix TaxID=153026 RepID=UPI0004202980|nr:TIGR01212 family radical SAM protein [Desulforegula conservatrix]